MTKPILKTFLLLAASFFAYINISAQPPKTAKEPFTYGEVLTYEGKLKTPGFPIVLSVADLSFSVVKSAEGNNFLIKADTKSKGTLTKIVGFKFLQQFESTVENRNFRILKTVKYDEQDERIRKSEAVFNYEDKKVTYVETDPANPLRPPRRIASSIEPETQDLISAIYSMRLIPLSVGKTLTMNVSDSGLVYKVPVRIAGREQVNSSLGKKWCFRLEPEVFGANRLIDQKGSMTIWITDDEKRIPVRARIETKIGRVEVRLKSLENSLNKTVETK